jgi:hypothetical protein
MQLPELQEVSMKILEKREDSPPNHILNWTAQLARMVGGAFFKPGPVRDGKTYVIVLVEGVVAECCIQDDQPADVAIALAGELARRHGKRVGEG